MGQLRSSGCPVCGTENGGKWTCPDCTDLVNVHRELIRNLQLWHALYASASISDIIVSSDGREYCLWDIQRLYEARHRVAKRQEEAIRMCLWENIAEKDAAVMMHISAKSPVAVYATIGLSRLLGMAYRDEIPGYRLRLDQGEGHS